jgi:hypothetical protein
LVPKESFLLFRRRRRRRRKEVVVIGVDGNCGVSF